MERHQAYPSTTVKANFDRLDYTSNMIESFRNIESFKIESNRYVHPTFL